MKVKKILGMLSFAGLALALTGCGTAKTANKSILEEKGILEANAVESDISPAAKEYATTAKGEMIYSEDDVLVMEDSSTSEFLFYNLASNFKDPAFKRTDVKGVDFTSGFFIIAYDSDSDNNPEIEIVAINGTSVMEKKEFLKNTDSYGIGDSSYKTIEGGKYLFTDSIYFKGYCEDEFDSSELFECRYVLTIEVDGNTFKPDYSSIKVYEYGEYLDANTDTPKYMGPFSSIFEGTEYGLKGYNIITSGNNIYVYDEKGNLSASIYAPNNVVGLNGKMLYQELQYTDGNSYTYISGKDKYILKTYEINLKNGNKKEVSFNYLLGNTITTISKEVDGINEIYAAYVNAYEIVDKKLSPISTSFYVTSNLKVYKEDRFVSITKIDDNQYFVKYTDHSNIVDAKGKLVKTLVSDSTNQISCGVYTACANNLYYLSTIDGKAITNSEYKQLYQISSNAFYASSVTGKKEILVIGSSNNILKTIDAQDLIVNPSALAVGSNLVTGSACIIDVNYSDSVYDIKVKTLDSELIVELSDVSDFEYDISTLNDGIIIYVEFKDGSSQLVKLY